MKPVCNLFYTIISGGTSTIMRIRLRIIYLLVLTTLSSDTIKRIILSDDRWFSKALGLVFLTWYLFALSKLLIKITNYYTAIPKNSECIHLQPLGKYYIAFMLFIYIGMYLVALNATDNFDFSYLLMPILISFSDDAYQVAYKTNGKKYYYSEEHNVPKEIKFYEMSGKFVVMHLTDGGRLMINTAIKTKKSLRYITEFFE